MLAFRLELYPVYPPACTSFAHLEPQTLTIGKDTRVAALEFCVHGIVVHLRLGNCIGYSLRESIPIDPFVAELD